MKKLFFLLMILGTATALSQQVGALAAYNAPYQFYQKTAYTAATANDTSAFLSLGGASDIVVFGSNNDSAAIALYYRLRSKNVGGTSGYTVTTGWTVIDTLGTNGDGTLDTTGAQRLGAIALTTLLGYDEIQFYVDYLTGTSVTDIPGETTNTARFFYYYKKSDAFIAR